MEIIRPSFTILAMTGHLALPYQYQPNPDLLLEACGRTCYKSEDKITEGSAVEFVKGVRGKHHNTVLEHSWKGRCYDVSVEKFGIGNWSKYLYISEYYHGIGSGVVIAGSIRAFEEAQRLNKALKEYEYRNLSEDELSFMASENEEPFLMRATVRLINDRGVSHEEVRHRPPAISQESTRYVNYNKRGMQTILPVWSPDEIVDPEGHAEWVEAMNDSERHYNNLIHKGWIPQRARSVLPNSLKTELCVSATLQEWQHIFMQRALSLTGKAHEQMEEIMIPLHNEFIKLEPSFFNAEGEGYK